MGSSLGSRTRCAFRPKSGRGLITSQSKIEKRLVQEGKISMPKNRDSDESSDKCISRQPSMIRKHRPEQWTRDETTPCGTRFLESAAFICARLSFSSQVHSPYLQFHVPHGVYRTQQHRVERLISSLVVTNQPETIKNPLEVDHQENQASARFTTKQVC